MDFFGNDKLTFKRVFNYLLGLWFITLGIGFSIKSNLGATPVSSIPYTLNLIWGIEIGKDYNYISCSFSFDRTDTVGKGL